MRIVFVSAGSGGGGGVTAVTGVAPITSSGGTTPAIGLTTPLSIANGGNGTATPTLTAGSNVTITGTWPNYTISASGGGSVTTDGVTITGNGTGGSPIAILAVQNDGVTLQGAGTVASPMSIKAVQTAARLTGAGTVASPLDISGWPLNAFVRTGVLTPLFGPTSSNTLCISAFQLPYALTFAHIGVYVGQADASHDSDLGLFNSAGTLVANIGATLISTTGEQSFATVQGSQTIPPGTYWFALTSTSTTIEIYGDNNGFCMYFSQNFGSSSGGALPASISPPAYSIGRNILVFMLF